LLTVILGWRFNPYANDGTGLRKMRKTRSYLQFLVNRGDAVPRCRHRVL
jgi:hypothetical protein